MALIKCKYCSHLVSDKAVKCPKCGGDLTQTEEPKQEVEVRETNTDDYTQTYQPEDSDAQQTQYYNDDLEEPKEGNGLKILLVILAVIAVGGIGYFLYWNNQQKELKAAIEAAQQDSIAAAQLEAEFLESYSKKTEKSETNAGTPITEYGYVDLGLPSGVKWGLHNIGADAEWKYGDYFAWGEIIPKPKYNKATSLTYGDSNISQIRGDTKYDAATANWGKPWRLPSIEEFNELIALCDWSWTNINNHNGYKITGPNGKSIFLPAAGQKDDSEEINVPSYREMYGQYLCSTPYDDSEYDIRYLHFYNGEKTISVNSRFVGMSVRPVFN